MFRLYPAPAVLALSALLFLAACDEEEGAPATPTATAAATAAVTPAISPTAPAATETPEPVPTGAFEGTRGPVEGCPGGTIVAFLTDVRTGRHDEGFDRVVFEFSDGIPCYRIEYVRPPILADPSGLEVEMDGAAFLQVRMESATAVDLSGATPRVTCCRSTITTGFPSLVDLEKIGDFEAVLLYVLGLSEEADFRVFELEDPGRIVIDVQHP